MADQEIVLSDGSVLLLPDDMPDEQVLVSVRNAEDQLTADANLSEDPAETDAWWPYIQKHAASTARGVGAGLSSTVDFLGQAVATAPRIAYNMYQGKPELEGLARNDVRDLYEQNVYAQPRGSDYETNAAFSEVLAPAVVETFATGSPKTAPLRAARDVALGLSGGEAGELVGDVYSEEAGDLGRMFGAAVTPLAGSRTGVKLATLKYGGPAISRVLNAMHLPNPFNAIPKRTFTTGAASAVGGGGSSQAYDYQQDEEHAARLRRLDEQNRLTMGNR